MGRHYCFVVRNANSGAISVNLLHNPAFDYLAKYEEVSRQKIVLSCGKRGPFCTSATCKKSAEKVEQMKDF